MLNVLQGIVIFSKLYEKSTLEVQYFMINQKLRKTVNFNINPLIDSTKHLFHNKYFRLCLHISILY